MQAQRSLLSTIFTSPHEPRLRAGWRLLLQVLMQSALSLGCGAILVIPYMLAGGPLQLAIPYMLAGGQLQFEGLGVMAANELLQLVSIAISVFVARRFLDRRSFSSLGVQLDRSSLVDLLVGVGIAGIMMTAIFAAECLAGWLTTTGFAWQTDALPMVVLNALASLLVFIFGGWNEELLSRGYHLQTIASGTNVFIGLIVSAAVFGALHLGNPHANWVSTTGIFAAGIFLGLAYLRTRRLWLPIGLHLGWNFFEGVVFGFPVSGMQTYHLLRPSVKGPELWTGGGFGPEAGLIVLPALGLGLLLVYLYSRRRTQ